MKLYDDYQADVQHAMHEIKTRFWKSVRYANRFEFRICVVAPPRA